LDALQDKPKLKVKMQAVSGDDVRKTLLEQLRFELVAKGVFRLGRCCIFWQTCKHAYTQNTLLYMKQLCNNKQKENNTGLP